MRILFVSNSPPGLVHSTVGNQQPYLRLRCLAQQHDFTIAYSNPQSEPEPFPSPLNPFRFIRLPSPRAPVPIAVESRPKSYWWVNAWRHAIFDFESNVFYDRGQPELKAALGNLIRSEQADVVHVYGMPMLYDLPIKPTTLLADLPDLYSNLFDRLEGRGRTKRTHSFQHELEIRKIKRAERRVLKTARAALFVSPIDLESARSLAGHIKMDYIPHGVELDYFSPTDEPEQPSTLLFSGSMSYFPNVEAVKYFVKEIMPVIRTSIPEIHLEIVGRNPAAQVYELQNDYVSVIGNVPDIRPYMQRATVCIVPLRNGGGVRSKIIEAWAMKKAVVSTSVGAEGLEGKNKEHIWIADDVNTFAEGVTTLVKDLEFRRRLGKNARELAVERYSLTNAAKQLDEIYHSIGGKSA